MKAKEDFFCSGFRQVISQNQKINVINEMDIPMFFTNFAALKTI